MQNVLGYRRCPELLRKERKLNHYHHHLTNISTTPVFLGFLEVKNESSATKELHKHLFPRTAEAWPQGL